MQGLLVFRERLRADAATTMAAVRELNVEVSLLTGDHPSRAAAVGRLLAAGSDVNRMIGAGQSPIMRAVHAGSEAIVELLLLGGADPNARERDTGNTALMLAANRGQWEIVSRLLEAGADASLVAVDGWTAAEAARMVGEDALARRLETAAKRQRSER